MPLPPSVTRPETEQDTDTLVEDEYLHRLIVWNDDVNTFDWVIQSLVEICGHSEEQAEQCAIIIHMRGKYAVKEASLDILKPMREGLTDRGIHATIDAVEV